MYNAYSYTLLTDPESSTSNGTLILQCVLNGGLSQQWSLSPLANPVSVVSYSPAPASAQLFNNGEPSYLDVEQGSQNDCWLMAALAEVAARDPQEIKNMFTYDGTTVDNGATVGIYTVRFFSNNGSAVYVQVDTELPAGGEYYDSVDNDLGTQALWVALAEKAYAVANGLGYVTTFEECQDSYAALNYGYVSWALQAITCNPGTSYGIDPTKIATAWGAGDLIALPTGTPASSYIVGGHAYAVVGYDGLSTKPFELFNPWGTDSSGWAPGYDNEVYGLFWESAAFISQNFKGQTFGAGETKVNNVTEPVNAVTELATLGDGCATSGTIKLTRDRDSAGLVDIETAIDQGNGGYSSANGYTRPAQGTAIGTDPGNAGDDGNTTARDVNNPTGPMVVCATGPTFTRTFRHKGFDNL